MDWSSALIIASGLGFVDWAVVVKDWPFSSSQLMGYFSKHFGKLTISCCFGVVDWVVMGFDFSFIITEAVGFSLGFLKCLPLAYQVGVIQVQVGLRDHRLNFLFVRMIKCFIVDHLRRRSFLLSWCFIDLTGLEVSGTPKVIIKSCHRI